jgi:hypothetical protein
MERTMETTFDSRFEERGVVSLPQFSDLRIMMMPIILGNMKSVPDFLSEWRKTLAALFAMGGHKGETGYLTIDEKCVAAGETHRRSGMHVDGILRMPGETSIAGSWGGGGGWGSIGNGMLTVASEAGCRAWNQSFMGTPGDQGECDHLSDQAEAGRGKVFEAGHVFWLDGLCVHESLPMVKDTNRQFVRLSLPSCAPWFDGYTENPLGVKPSGPILERRAFMDM